MRGAGWPRGAGSRSGPATACVSWVSAGRRSIWPGRSPSGPSPDAPGLSEICRSGHRGGIDVPDSDAAPDPVGHNLAPSSRDWDRLTTDRNDYLDGCEPVPDPTGVKFRRGARDRQMAPPAAGRAVSGGRDLPRDPPRSGPRRVSTNAVAFGGPRSRPRAMGSVPVARDPSGRLATAHHERGRAIARTHPQRGVTAAHIGHATAVRDFRHPTPAKYHSRPTRRPVRPRRRRLRRRERPGTRDRDRSPAARSVRGRCDHRNRRQHSHSAARTRFTPPAERPFEIGGRSTRGTVARPRREAVEARYGCADHA